MRGTLKSKLAVVVASMMSIASLVLLPRMVAQEAEIAPAWSVTGGLSSIRSGYTATLLPNGKVLVAGGEELLQSVGGSEWVTNKAELYDPATGVWSPTGNLTWGRVLHTATLLPNSKVLVVGGWGGSDQLAHGAELYDPSTGTWSLSPGWGGYLSHSDVVAERQGPDCRWRLGRPICRPSWSVRPSHGHGQPDWQPSHGTRLPHCDSAAQRKGSHRRWCQVER